MKLLHTQLLALLLIGSIIGNSNAHAFSETQAHWGSAITGVAVGTGVTYGVFQYLQKQSIARQYSQAEFDDDVENIKVRLINDSNKNFLIALSAGIASGAISGFVAHKLLDRWVTRPKLNTPSRSQDANSSSQTASSSRPQTRSTTPQNIPSADPQETPSRSRSSNRSTPTATPISDPTPQNPPSSTQPGEAEECPICDEENPANMRTPCGHPFHQNCINNWINTRRQQGQQPNCPNCRGPIN